MGIYAPEDEPKQEIQEFHDELQKAFEKVIAVDLLYTVDLIAQWRKEKDYSLTPHFKYGYICRRFCSNRQSSANSASANGCLNQITMT